MNLFVWKDFLQSITKHSTTWRVKILIICYKIYKTKQIFKNPSISKQSAFWVASQRLLLLFVSFCQKTCIFYEYQMKMVRGQERAMATFMNWQLSTNFII